jgi:hypothetical protein
MHHPGGRRSVSLIVKPISYKELQELAQNKTTVQSPPSQAHYYEYDGLCGQGLSYQISNVTVVLVP